MAFLAGVGFVVLLFGAFGIGAYRTAMYFKEKYEAKYGEGTFTEFCKKIEIEIPGVKDVK